MSGPGSTANDALSAYLQQAAADLARSNEALGADAEGLLFLGAWHQSYPAILVRDPFLSDSAKVQFLYLMQESSQNPHSAIAMPSLLETGRVLGHAKKTVHRDRTLLRICRWISQHKRVRDQRGRYCGSINAIHSEPCSLDEASRLDATYLQLLDESRTHPDRYVQRAAQAALASIDQALADGRDPMAPPDPMNRRLDAARAVQNGGGSFFDLLMPDGGPIAKSHDPSAGHSVASGSDREKFTPGDPSVNFTPGQNDPSVKFTPGCQHTDNKEKDPSYPQKAKFTPGCPTYVRSSSSTTTDSKTDSARESPSDDSPSESSGSLRWPDAMHGSQRAKIAELADFLQLTLEQQQNVLDVLEHKLADPDNPLRNPAGYAFTLCKRVESGTFNPIGAPSADAETGGGKSSADREIGELRQQLRTLHSEIDGMESTLIPGAPPENRPALEAQRDRLRSQSSRLKERLRALRGTANSRNASHA